MRNRIGLILAFSLGVVIPAWMATGATFALCIPDTVLPSQLTAIPAGGAAPWQGAAEVGLLIALLGPFVAVSLMWFTRRQSRNQRIAMRAMWESITGRSLEGDENKEDMVGVARSMATEFGVLHRRKTELKSKFIRVEHTLKEMERKRSNRTAEMSALADAKSKADCAIASLRDQIKTLEKKLSRFRKFEGDSWFAALVREMLAPIVEESPDDSNDTGEMTAERRVLSDLFKLADVSCAERSEPVQKANLEEMLEQATAGMNNQGGVTLRLKPEATWVLTNRVALELLFDYIIRHVDRRGGNATIRAWREQSARGVERVRMAIERRDSSLEKVFDSVSARGLASLARSAIKTEHFDDERVAHVIYFESAIVESLTGQEEDRPNLQRRSMNLQDGRAAPARSQRHKKHRANRELPDNHSNTLASDGDGLRRRVRVLSSGEVRPIAAAKTG
jgi:hypothetical protein